MWCRLLFLWEFWENNGWIASFIVGKRNDVDVRSAVMFLPGAGRGYVA